MAIIYYLTRVIQCYYFREHRSSTIWRQNRHILRKLHNSKDVVFGKFIKRLSKTQPGVSKRIQAVQGQFRLYRKDKRSTSEDDFASDFDPGFFVPEDMSNADICKAAEILESLNCSSRLTIVCRQKKSNPYDFVIECIKPDEKPERLEMLKELE
ncbi:Hypothetical predicted protein [Mytilus galloprovincialis]|uniref:Uncharacterized protein n=1 Tax=Mytilus galloprovincialis TaxID=29158 RepID=A0A8B6ERN2_MYTGA|nr:Hypothetical predicted protein [Mytilus galloprovincialis]